MKTFTPYFIVVSTLLVGACASSMESLAPPHPPLVEGKTVDVVAHPDMRRLMRSRDPALAANKRLVFDMWRTVLNAGQVEAADRFLSPDYQEHSIVMPTGLDGFRQYHGARISRSDSIPALISDPIVTMVAEGDYVAVARAAEYLEPDDSGATYSTTYFDVFRISAGKIAEHWDSAQIIPGQIPLTAEQGGALPVVGTEGFAQLAMLQNTDPLLANNKRLAFDLWRHTSEAGREEMAYNYLDPIYIQHNPNAATGREGMKLTGAVMALCSAFFTAGTCTSFSTYTSSSCTCKAACNPWSARRISAVDTMIRANA